MFTGKQAKKRKPGAKDLGSPVPESTDTATSAAGVTDSVGPLAQSADVVGMESEVGSYAGSQSESGAGRPSESDGAASSDSIDSIGDFKARLARLEADLAKQNEKADALAYERDQWQAKAAIIHDQYLRSKADLDSFRKRTERDFEDRLAREKAGFLRELLSVADNFQLFVSAAGDPRKDEANREFDAFVKGVRMIQQQFSGALRKEGVEEIQNSVGQVMDPAYHEAVIGEEASGAHGTVLAELQKGYTYKGLVLRPTKVKVVR